MNQDTRNIDLGTEQLMLKRTILATRANVASYEGNKHNHDRLIHKHRLVGRELVTRLLMLPRDPRPPLKALDIKAALIF
jgi:hypothetical protein